jgi:subtilisin family serine protease
MKKNYVNAVKCLLIVFFIFMQSGIAVFASDSGSQEESIFIELWAPPLTSLWADPDFKQDNAGSIAQAQKQLAEIIADQDRFISAVIGKSASPKILFKTQRVLNGIAILATQAELEVYRRLPEVKSVSVLATFVPNEDAEKDLEYLGIPEVWDTLGLGLTGAGIRVGLIDTGIDYIHKHLGGTGDAGDYTAIDPSSANPALFPNLKVVGGYDLAGTGATWPIPNPDDNPIDYNGHGTANAGIIAGIGLTDTGDVFTGPYDQVPDYRSFRLQPGVAPEAELYAIKVFPDTTASIESSLVVAGIEWALDPNGDADFSDRMDVILLALGGTRFTVDSNDIADIAIRNAVAAGVVVVGSIGNNGNIYGGITGRGNADAAIGVAASQPPTLQNQVVFTATWVPTAPEDPGFIDIPMTCVFGHFPQGTTVSGNLVYTDPALGCTAFVNAGDVNGNIAFVDRGTCQFVAKEMNAYSAGATALVVVQNVAVAPFLMGGLANILPSLMISLADGNVIKGYMNDPLVTSVSMTIDDTNLVLNTAVTDTIYTSSSRGPSWSAQGLALKPDVTAPGTNIRYASAFTGDNVAAASGTSYSAAYVVGLAALLLEDDPSATPFLLKTRIMNGAIHDIFAGENFTPPRQSPCLIGAGRIDPANALGALMQLHDKEFPERVSVVFPEYDVLPGQVFEREVRIQNLTSETLDLTITLDEVVLPPGVTVNITAPTTTLEPDGFIDAVLGITIAYDLMAPFRDPAYLSTPFLTETAGFITVNTSSLGYPHSLRVPYLASLRPATAMQTDIQMLNLGPDVAGTLAINLQGQGLSSNPFYESRLWCFEAQWRSPGDPTLYGPDFINDIDAVGVASNYYVQGENIGATTLYFAVTTRMDWLSSLYAGTITIEFDLNGDLIADASQPVQSTSFMHDTFLYTLNASALGLTTENSTLRYRIVSVGATTKWLVYDVARPGLDFSNGGANGNAYYYLDEPGTQVYIQYNIANILKNRSLGALLIHRNNQRGLRQEFLPLNITNPFFAGIPVVCADFEVGLDGYVLSNDTGAGNGLWRLASDCGISGQALHFGNDSCNYDSGIQVEGAAISPLIDLGEVAGSVYLKFQYFLETDGGDQTDIASVLIEVEGETGGAVVASNSLLAEGIVTTLHETAGAWREALVNISEFSGKQIRLHFHFDSVNGDDNNYFGFAVDNVCVLGETVVADGIDSLVVSDSEFRAVGNDGGPFTPAEHSWVLANAGTTGFDWVAENTIPWIQLDRMAGTLEPGETVLVTATFTSQANTLPDGEYSGMITFTNDTTAFVRPVKAYLTISIPLCESVDYCALEFVSGGDLPWYGQGALSKDGIDAARSGNIGHSRETWFETTVTGPGAVEFWWKVSSEVDWDFLQFYVDDTLMEQISGEVDWQQKRFVIDAGEKVLRWRYAKDTNTAINQDCGWVDMISFGKLTVAPNDGLISYGDAGGPFTPSSKIYTLTNSTLEPITWTAETGVSWAILSASGGTLAAGTSEDITVALNADMLEPGYYTADMIIEDVNSGDVFSRKIDLQVILPLCESLDNCNLIWNTSGDAGWFGQAFISQDQEDAAQNYPLANSQQAWLETTVTGPASLDFWWKVSSEESGDYLELWVDGLLVDRISGEVDWTQNIQTISDGPHDVAWVYRKNSQTSRGDDAGWVDRVVVQAFSVTPEDNLASSGFKGGPFAPAQQVYTIKNGGSEIIPWSVTADVPWMSFSVQTGNLFVAATQNITATINGDDLPTGRYVGNITFTDTASGFSVFRTVTLDVEISLCEALDNCAITWNTSGDALWQGQGTISQDVVDAAQSGTIGNAEQTLLETTLTGPGTLSFWWKVSSQEDHDWLEFQEDGNLVERISGDSGWRYVSHTLPAGAHTMTWRYIKDAYASAGSDAAWVDTVIYDGLSVTPVEEFVASIVEAGTYESESRTYTLQNSSDVALNWSATPGEGWLSVTPPSGELASGAFTDVIVGLAASVQSLAPGHYQSDVVFTNTNSGITQQRAVSLTVVPAPGILVVEDSFAPADDAYLYLGDICIGDSGSGTILLRNDDDEGDINIYDIFGGNYESFDGKQWISDAPEYWTIQSGEYRAQADMVTVIMQNYFADQTWTDISFSGEIRREGDTTLPTGLVIRASSDFYLSDTDAVGSAYVAAFTGDQTFAVFKVVDGTQSWLSGPYAVSPFLNPGEDSNIMEFHASGTTLNLFINGELVWTGIDDSIVGSGRIGIFGATEEANPAVYFFDDLWMSGLNGDAGDFVLENLPALPIVLAPQQELVVDVSFTASTAGNFEGIVYVLTDASNTSTATIALAASAIACEGEGEGEPVEGEGEPVEGEGEPCRR